MRTLDTGEPFQMYANFTTAKGNARRVRYSSTILSHSEGPLPGITAGLFRQILAGCDLNAFRV